MTMIITSQVPWLTMTQAAALLGVTYQTIRKMVQKKELEHEHTGYRILVSSRNVFQLLQEKKFPGQPKQKNGEPHQLMTYAEAGAYLRTGQQFARNLADKGELNRVKIGRKAFVTRESVEKYLQKVLNQ